MACAINVAFSYCTVSLSPPRWRQVNGIREHDSLTNVNWFVFIWLVVFSSHALFWSCLKSLIIVLSTYLYQPNFLGSITYKNMAYTSFSIHFLLQYARWLTVTSVFWCFYSYWVLTQHGAATPFLPQSPSPLILPNYNTLWLFNYFGPISVLDELF